MDFQKVLTRNEVAIFTLRALYNEYGYKMYKMSKFEEYDLYVKNKDFLVSENVITFTDTDGRLMALKPDVTLSIIKNSKIAPDDLMKVYYNENVYRVSKGTKSYKEIMQVGIEALGKVSLDTVCEVLYLAKKSLDTLSKNNVLEISHLSLVSGVFNAFGISSEGQESIFKYLGEKNVYGVINVCECEGLDKSQTELISKLVTVYGTAEKVLPLLDAFAIDKTTSDCVLELKNILNDLTKKGVIDNVVVDFSVVNDMKYYNGFAFKGFIEGIPAGILSGGQYDNLMAKMNKKQKAIGFAVYLDELEKLSLLGGNNND